MEGKKRLFFGLSLQAPWPEEFPHGRLLLPQDRHLTLAFLSNVDAELLFKSLPQLTIPFCIGTAGFFDSCLFLSPHNPNVVAWSVKWLDDEKPLIDFQKSLNHWLIEIGYAPTHPERKWLPHATLARRPFDRNEWATSFKPIPLITTAIHLYESLGQLKYQPRWSHMLIPPFNELDHTADIAFKIYGTTLEQIHRHAQTALFFKDPKLISYSSAKPVQTLDDVIIDLNSIISKADQEQGCALKAVSFHGELLKDANNTLSWEMIVDV